MTFTITAYADTPAYRKELSWYDISVIYCCNECDSIDHVSFTGGYNLGGHNLSPKEWDRFRYEIASYRKNARDRWNKKPHPSGYNPPIHYVDGCGECEGRYSFWDEADELE